MDEKKLPESASGEEKSDGNTESVASCSGVGAAEVGAVGGVGSKVDALLQDAVRLKTEGNACYREKRVRAAIGRYHRALLVLRGLDSDVTAAIQGIGPQLPTVTPKQEELLRNTQVDCYNNLAACLLQRESVDYARVQEYSLRVLQWRPGDIKALYRAGVAALELGDAQAARHYLCQASRGQPNDPNVKRHLLRAEERLSSDYQREKAFCKGMFAKQTDEAGEGGGDSRVSQK